MPSKFSGIHDGEPWAVEVSYDRFADHEPFVVDLWVNFEDKEGAAPAFLDPAQARALADALRANADLCERANGSEPGTPADGQEDAPWSVVPSDDDPEVMADLEAAVEAALAEHQEPDGSYSCDSHVMVSYVLAALRGVRGGGERRATEHEAPGCPCVGTPDQSVDRDGMVRIATEAISQHDWIAAGYDPEYDEMPEPEPEDRKLAEYVIDALLRGRHASAFDPTNGPTSSDTPSDTPGRMSA